MNIAVLYTCFNRKEKTLSSLNALYVSLSKYNLEAQDKANIEVFLTDDGCTDGTSDAIKKTYVDKDIHILKGDGTLFWAGGMRLAWKEALKRHTEWDFYLLINDDTDIFDTCIQELMDTHYYCIETYRKAGIYSGVTCSKADHSITTYGGDIFTSRFLGRYYRVKCIGSPQLVDTINANILLVPQSIVEMRGIFYEGFRHGNADWDYSMQARKNGIPVLVTANYCGACDNDHESKEERKNKLLSMTQEERSNYFKNPLHSSCDYLTFVKRNIPVKYPITMMFRFLQEFYPGIYYIIKN